MPSMSGRPPPPRPPPILTGALRRRLLALAGRRTSCPSEAEDIVQDALVAAWRAGRLPGGHDAGTREDLAWLGGVIRRRAAFLARTAGRRRARERAWSELQAAPETVEAPTDLPPLPPSLSRVARLALAGCTRAELAWILDLRDDTLRQRIHALRRRVGPEPTLATADRPSGDGARRPALRAAALRRACLASHDPDGHGVLIDCSRIGGPRQP